MFDCCLMTTEATSPDRIRVSSSSSPISVGAVALDTKKFTAMIATVITTR